MRFANLFFSLTALALTVSIHAATPPPMVRTVRAVSDVFVEHLEKRQIGGSGFGTVPAQCTSVCNPVNSEISLGCPVTACCTAIFETDYYNCLECVGTSINATNYATAQSDLNLLYTTCVDMGYTLPQLALPGQPASGSSGTAPVSAPTTSTTPASTRKSTSGAVSGASRGGIEALVGAAVLLGAVGIW